MDYAEGEPWVTPSKSFLLSPGIREGKQLSELLGVDCDRGVPTWVQAAGFPVFLPPRKDRQEGWNSPDGAVFRDSLTLPGLVSEHTACPTAFLRSFGG